MGDLPAETRDLVDVLLVVGLVPILAGLGEALRRALRLDPEIVPLVQIVAGIVLAVSYTLGVGNWVVGNGRLIIAVLSGMTAGLAAARLMGGMRARQTPPPPPPREE